MDDNATKQPANLNVVGSDWCQHVLARAIGFLTVFAETFDSPSARIQSESLKIVRDGFALPIASCPTCEGIESKYPVLCSGCATALGAVSPQKFVIRAEATPESADTETWFASFFGVAFVLQVINRPNSLAGAEALLDELHTEADVKHLQQLCDLQTHMSGSKTELPN